MQRSHIELWEECRQKIRDNVSKEAFDAWFEPITSLSFSDEKIRLYVPSEFFVEQLEERYFGLLQAVIKKVYGDDAKLYWVCNTVKDDPSSATNSRSSSPSPTIMTGDKVAPANPFADNLPKTFDSQLNPRYNFENYCFGESNAVARSIAESIANDPTNKTFNPLFVFGPTGVGKTHLIQAVGIRIKERNPNARVLYVTARLFQSQYTAANHKGQINNFFHFYQSIDTLIVDDVQDLAGKPETQNTFFHIFNQLHQNNRQIIMSSDCPPSEMDGFEARLLSRFKWGMTAQLYKPDAELRRQVLIKKTEQAGIELPTEVIDYIVENVTDSIRELEGIVASLTFHATKLNCEMTLALTERVVANAVRIRRRQVNFEMVTEAVSTHFKINSDTLFTKSRKREISDARQILMYFAKKYVGLSLKHIGAKLGRTHATVLYACRNIEERLPLDKDLRASIDAVRELIESN